MYKMYSIGDFAKICRVPVHTIRYWEKEGLLFPEKIDEATGYRFYSSQQLYAVQKIKSAKLDKFKNKEIRRIINKPVGMKMLLEKREELLKAKSEIEDSICHLDFAINTLVNQKDQKYNFVVIKNIPEGFYITHRQIFKNIHELIEYYVAMYNSIWHGNPPLTDPYECFTIYYHDDLPEENLDAECCIQIDDNFDIKCLTNTDFQIKRIRPLVGAVSCLHYGPHESLGETFDYLLDWVGANGFEMDGYPRHNVISNEDTPDISNYLFNDSNESQVCVISEIIIPIKKKAVNKSN